MIGIFGGTFDPIHIGHLCTVADVQQALALEQVRIVPLCSPSHRPPPTASTEQRLRMLEAAIASNPGFTVDDREVKREGTSYTVDTLKSLKREFGDDQTLCLIIGSDAFAHLPGWRQPEMILKLAHLIIMHRPREPIAGHFIDHQTNDPLALKLKKSGCILTQPVTQLDISSSNIRQRLKRGEIPRYLVPKGVLEIISHERIYA